MKKGRDLKAEKETIAFFQFSGGSSYDALDVFTSELKQSLEKMGYAVIVVECNTPHNLFYSRLLELQSYHLKFLLVFNAVVNALFSDDRFVQYLNLLKVPYCVFLVDHPCWHHERLTLPLENYHVFTLDEHHKHYIEAHYHNIKGAAMIPLGGLVNESIRPYGERQKKLVFLGSYQNPEKILDEVEAIRLNHVMLNVGEVVYGILEEIMSDLSLPVDAAFEAYVKKNQLEPLFERIDLKDISLCLRYADAYIRAYFRQLVLKTILKAGLEVDVYGKGWENFECEAKENLRIHPPINYRETNEVMNDARIVLNIMPWFKEGVHDRIFNAMLAGAVCVTDSSTWIEQEFQPNEDIVLFSLNALNRLPALLMDLLVNTEKAERIAKAGFERASARHTWDCRAEEVIRYIEQLPTEGSAETSAEQERIPEIKLFLTDCDGCLTDGGMYYSEHGDELKKFNAKDGVGFSLLRSRGILTGIVTGEAVELNRRRAAKLKLDILEPGCTDKATAVKRLCEEHHVSLENVAYIGDDLNDLEVLQMVGVSCAPADAVPQVKSVVDYVARAKGGEGVIREVADMLLSVMGEVE